MEHRDVAPLPAADDTVAPRTYRFELRKVEYSGGRVGVAKTIVEVLARGVVGDIVHGAAEEAPRDRGAAALLVRGGERRGHVREEDARVAGAKPRERRLVSREEPDWIGSAVHVAVAELQQRDVRGRS